MEIASCCTTNFVGNYIQTISSRSPGPGLLGLICFDFRCTAKTKSVFAVGVLGEGGFEYSRGGNPTRSCLEMCVAKIDGGQHAFVFSSGKLNENKMKR
jgi:O-acetylhomoserine/O-acetylserine sulfhydrylase-like pyridoxal-dependent enzyme